MRKPIVYDALIGGFLKRKNQVGYIYLPGFLRLCCFLFQNTAYGDGVTKHVAGSLSYLIPVLISLPCLVGIREKDHSPSL